MSGPNKLAGVQLAVTVLALLTSCGAIALHFFDRPEERAHEAPRPVLRHDAPPSPGADLGGPVQMAEVTARCLPSVVNISTRRVVQASAAGNPFFDVFRQFFGLGEPAPNEGQSLGSGVIVGDDGLVVTNHHVVADAAEIRVTLSDGTDLAADIVGSDPESDVAVLRIRREDGVELTPLAYGDSSVLRQGDVVLAIGNPFGVGQTVTMGIVSATGRASMGITDYEDFIQTDAAINPGNSGGALVNLRGELIGINTAILSRTGGSHGIGFAIPSNMARPIVTALLRDGHVTRGWLGASLQDVTPDVARALSLPRTHGVVVMDVVPDSPASSAGLARGDLIARLDSDAITSSRQLRNLIATRGAGATVELTRVRGEESAVVSAVLRERPAVPLGQADALDPASATGGTDVAGVIVAPLDAAARSRFSLSDAVREGVVVVGTREGTPGASAGFQAGDVIMAVGGAPVRTPEEFSAAYESSLFVAMVSIQRGTDTRVIMLRR